MREPGPLRLFDKFVLLLAIIAIYLWYSARPIQSTNMAIQVIYFDMGGVLADDMWYPTEEFVLKRYG